MQHYKPLFCPSVGLSIMFVNFCIFGVAAQIERDRETDSETETGTATSVHWSVCFVTYLRESTCTRGPYLPLFLCAFVGCEFARQSTMPEGLSVSVLWCQFSCLWSEFFEYMVAIFYSVVAILEFKWSKNFSLWTRLSCR